MNPDILGIMITRLCDVFLAIRSDMTPEQQKAFWLWIARRQKELDDPASFKEGDDDPA